MNNSALQALIASGHLSPNNIRSLGIALRRPNIVRNQERKRIRNALNRSPKDPYNLGLVNSTFNRVRQVHHNNKNRMVNNILILAHPNKVRLTPAQLKRILRLYGNVMLKINRNKLVGRNRTGQTWESVYFKSYPSKRTRALKNYGQGGH